MWESLFGSAIAPAVQAGANEAMQTAIPALTDTAINAGLDSAITGGMGNVGTSMLGNALPTGVNAVANPMLAGAGQGMFSSLGNFGNALTSDQGANVFKGLGGAYNAYSQGKALNNANDIQRQQLAMQQDAYNRDKTADTNRQKLVF